mmetsp:Transcript_23584/g.3905  ORF Transcript_23584/g.3905 Transcript_23584/m.3905 type:complete len:99 (-) Transcript_23584:632-928(-)
MLDESLKKRDRNKVLDQLDSDGEDDEEIKKINLREEDWLHTAISEVLGSLFKTHTEHSLNIVNFMYTNVLSKFLTDQSSKEDIKFAIFVIDDIIEFIG